MFPQTSSLLLRGLIKFEMVPLEDRENVCGVDDANSVSCLYIYIYILFIVFFLFTLLYIQFDTRRGHIACR